MRALRHILPVLGLLVCLWLPSVEAAEERDDDLAQVVQQLNVSAAQQASINAILARGEAERAQLQAARRANREALASTAPSDPNYTVLLETAKLNAVARVQQASDLKVQVYAVLTPEQQAQVPAIVAVARSEREARVAAQREQQAAPPQG